jgi:hypothetical protein
MNWKDKLEITIYIIGFLVLVFLAIQSTTKDYAIEQQRFERLEKIIINNGLWPAGEPLPEHVEDK